MAEFRYYHPIQVRYGDLDPQGHVNNAAYLTYMEQCRVGYLQHLGLWDGQTFEDVGIIVADIQVTFLAPICYGERVRVGGRVSRLGDKSLEMKHAIEDEETQRELAHGTAVLVTYDYRTQRSIQIPETWRKIIAAFDGISPLDR